MDILTPVVLIVTNEESEVLLVKPKKEWVVFGQCWSLPGGVPFGKENFEQALIRSISEELRCRLKSFEYYKSSYYKTGPSLHYRSMYFHGEIDGDILLSDKLDESRWFSLTQLKDPELMLAADQKDVIFEFFQASRTKQAGLKRKSLFNI